MKRPQGLVRDLPDLRSRVGDLATGLVGAEGLTEHRAGEHVHLVVSGSWAFSKNSPARATAFLWYSASVLASRSSSPSQKVIESAFPVSKSTIEIAPRKPSRALVTGGCCRTRASDLLDLSLGRLDVGNAAEHGVSFRGREPACQRS